MLLALPPGTLAQNVPSLIELPAGVIPADVHDSGFAVVGSILGAGADPQFGNQAFYWTPLTGVVPIGGTQGVAISRDGRTIAGRALDAQGRENAAIWLGGTEWQVLGSFTSDAQACDRLLSGAFGMSAKGDVLVGLGWDGCRLAHAFRWQKNTGMVDLGSSVPGRASRANAISGDGQIVVGWQDDASGFRQGAVWREGRQEVVMGPFGAVGEAQDTNFDGSIIVGQGCDPVDLSAWSWTSETGVMCHRIEAPEDPIPFLTMMLATSDDGRVIGGARSFGLDSEAILWLDGEPHYLKDYLRANGVPDAFSNWINTGFLTSVSTDGRVLVGNGAGPRNFQGYIVMLPLLAP